MKSKKYRLSCFGLSLVLSISVANAGGVSDGGGGTTNPIPVDPKSVVKAATYGGGSEIILAWLYRREESFGHLSPLERAKSPYRKLFGSPTDIIEVTKHVQFELRMKGPCYDASGAPKDGSIFGSQPGALCLSPYSMAPKLNEANVERETVALMIHEISHLLGTTEDEAVAIQKDAIGDLDRLDFVDTLVEIDILAGESFDGDGGEISDAMSDPATWTLNPRWLSADDAHRWKDALRQLSGELNPTGPLLYLRNAWMKLYAPLLVEVDVIGDYACVQDIHEDAGVQADCVQNLDRTFRSDTSVTARQAILRRDGTDLGSDFDLVSIKRPQVASDVSDDLREVGTYLTQIRDETRSLQSFRIGIFQTE